MKGKITVLVGGQYGSEGKGAIAAHIAEEYDVHVRVGSPNAGHTIYWNGEKHVMQTIPCGWINENAEIVIGRGSLINMKFLMREIMHILKYFPDFLYRLHIDPEAGVLDERFHEEEGGIDGEMHKRIGSTGEGVGPARIARIERDPSKFRLFKDVAHEYGLDECIAYNTPSKISMWQNVGRNILVEGTQGSALSLFHSFWPYCTSTDTNAAGIIADVGIAPTRVSDVIMVCRTFPIRVAGNSGPMRNEISWDEIVDASGNQITPEKTTVTHKVRRIARWDYNLYRQSCILNDPSCIALTFADYIDPMLYGATTKERIMQSKALSEFMVKHEIIDKVKYIGTGPQTVVNMWGE